MLNHNVVAEGLVRFTNWFGAHEIWDCCMAFIVGPVFEESYAIRSALVAGPVLQLGKPWLVAQAFCDRAVRTQGVVEENMYYMGYANERNAAGIPACSCVADASSTAQAIVDTIQTYPDLPKKEAYLKSLRAFLDYVLDRYTTQRGVIGVGILSHKINPFPEYWCANALFTPILIGFAQITGEDKYFDAAVSPLEYLARFDYKTIGSGGRSHWQVSPTEVIAYSSEGLLAGLLSEPMQRRLNIRPTGIGVAVAERGEAGCAGFDDAPNRVRNAEEESAKASGPDETVRRLMENRWNEFAAWLYRNQEPNGVWQETRDYRAYQLALSWTILRACRGLGTNLWLERCAERQLAYLLSQEAKSVFGLFCRPFATANAHLSFAYAAKILMQEDPEQFTKAMSEAQKKSADHLW